MAFGGKSSQKPSAGIQAQQNGPQTQADDGVGYEVDGGRGRGRDGVGTYEMVGIAPKEPV